MPTSATPALLILPPDPTVPADEPPGVLSPFEAVVPALRPALEAKGFSELTEVQAAVLAADADGRDLRISSRTGSGKTVAVGFALAADLIEAAGKDSGTVRGPLALIITPTRELANQVHKELDWLFSDLRDIRVDSVTGGTHVGRERQRLRQRPTILVGTPGRLLDHLRSNQLDLTGVRHVILDEADQMLDLGFRDELDGILDALPPQRRTHLMSATFPPAVERLTQRYQSDPVIVNAHSTDGAHGDILHEAILIRGDQRYAALGNLLLLAQNDRCLVFVRTRAEAAELGQALSKDGFSAMVLSGDLQQAQRTRTLEAFRAGTVTTLVATDVAARGLDVPDVSLVVQFDPPNDSQVYTHRSGRTGRAGRKGRCTVLVPPSGRRRTERLFQGAGVDIVWRAAPTAEEVTAEFAERARARVRCAVDGDVHPSEEQLACARELLAGRDAERVVANLLAQVHQDLPHEPFEIHTTPVPSKNLARHERGHSSDERPARDDYAWFGINWGTRKGATVPRILAHVCRRGNVDRKMIGRIQLDTYRANVQVANAVAVSFAEAASKRDSRDPRLVIRRSGKPATSNGRAQKRSG